MSILRRRLKFRLEGPLCFSFYADDQFPLDSFFDFDLNREKFSKFKKMTGSVKAFVQEYFTRKSLFITRDWNKI